MPLWDELSGELRRSGKIRLRVKVSPKSSKTELVGKLPDGTLRIRVAAAPEKGRANAELCAYVAKALGVPKAKVNLVSGSTSTWKTIAVGLQE